MSRQHGRLARQQARRRQRERLVGIGVVVLGILVLVVAIFALHEPKGHVSANGSRTTRTVVSTIENSPSPSRSTPTSSSSAPPSTSSSTGSPAPTGTKAVPLVVLNDTRTFGLAKQAAKRFGAGGWTVSQYGNLPDDITDIESTCAYYDPSVTGAQAAAKALQQQYPTIKRVKEKFAELPAGPVVVVLTPDYSSD